MIHLVDKKMFFNIISHFLLFLDSRQRQSSSVNTFLTSESQTKPWNESFRDLADSLKVLHKRAEGLYLIFR